jgi:hypothetical protein
MTMVSRVVVSAGGAASEAGLASWAWVGKEQRERRRRESVVGFMTSFESKSQEIEALPQMRTKINRKIEFCSQYSSLASFSPLKADKAETAALREVPKTDP